MTSSGTYHFQEAYIEYVIMGKGPHHVIAFHGFGQDAHVYEPLSASLSHIFTIHSFSLFWHGKSVPSPAYHPGEIALPPDFYADMIREYTEAKGISEFSLLGNSMGGRIALSLVEKAVPRLRCLFLLAPDGVRKSFWYHFATHHRLGKYIFRYSLHHPVFFFRTVRFFRMLDLVSPAMEKFAVSQFSREENRRKVFRVWNLYADIVPDLSEIKRLLIREQVTGCIFTGKRDPVLDKHTGRRFLEGLEENFIHIPLDTGHELLKEHLVPVIAATIMKSMEKRKPSPREAKEGNIR